MDKEYYKLIEEAIEINRLTIEIFEKALHNEVIKASTDSLIIDAIKGLRRTINMLHEVLNRQEYAYIQSMPK